MLVGVRMAVSVIQLTACATVPRDGLGRRALRHVHRLTLDPDAQLYANATVTALLLTGIL